MGRLVIYPLNPLVECSPLLFRAVLESAEQTLWCQRKPLRGEEEKPREESRQLSTTAVVGLWGFGPVALPWLREKEESQYELLIFKPDRQHSSLGSKGSRTGLVVE